MRPRAIRSISYAVRWWFYETVFYVFAQVASERIIAPIYRWALRRLTMVREEIEADVAAARAELERRGFH